MNFSKAVACIIHVLLHLPLLLLSSASLPLPHRLLHQQYVSSLSMGVVMTLSAAMHCG